VNTFVAPDMKSQEAPERNHKESREDGNNEVEML